MEDVKIKAKAVNDFKLPFELSQGVLGKLTVQIPWKSNFSAPTIIEVENVDIVLNFLSPLNWDFIDYYSYEVKLKYLERFFTSNQRVKTGVPSSISAPLTYITGAS